VKLEDEGLGFVARAANGFPQALEEAMKLYSLGALVGLVAGCRGYFAEVAPSPLAAASDSAEYAAFAGSGEHDLRGQALLTTRAGEVKLAAGRLVTLDPATTYARRWFRRFGGDVERFQVPGINSRFAAARKMAVADAEGRFWFTRLRAGSYLVRSAVTWKGEADSVVQGGVVAALATLGEGETPELILHQLYTPDSTATLAVAIVSDAELAARKFRPLGRVSGSSCETQWEEPARKDLVLEAGRKGADAVARVACRKRGLSLTGCLSRMVCEGDAVVWM